MPIEDLKHQIARLPEQPGVYVFLGRDGQTLYVGKAAHLRDRVSSYLGARGASPRHDRLLDEVDHVDVVVTDSVVEALALENNLIKQRLPRFNILLRDDKNYPYLKLTTTESFPRVLVARRVERDGDVYAGPFMPASLARKTMRLTHRVFGIRSCQEHITGARGRACLEFDIGRCLAPCVETLCTAEQYAAAVVRTRLLFEGRTDELIGRLTTEMHEAAEGESFEQAAHLRDAIHTLETLRDRQQKMATPTLGDRDAFGLKSGPSGTIIQVFQMRNGRVIERVELVAEPDAGGDEPEQNVLGAALGQFYQGHDIPPEIHVAGRPDDGDALESWLSARAGRRVTIAVPRSQDRRGLLDLATRNASMAYQSRFSGGAVANYEALESLRAILSLPAFPRRIECIDISTLQGAETVASLVVCEDGRMRRSEYRKFRVRGAASAAPAKPDDCAAMREVVLRRYQGLLARGGPFPDLVLVDGGRGQVESAYEALESLGLGNLVAAGLAKKEELIVTRDRPEPIALDVDHPTLLLLRRIRDEAHRVAVSFHRHARRTRDLRSELDDIAGIGPRRRNALLRTFGSAAGVRRASREDLCAVVGARAADAVLAHFARG
ncbi:MAG: excinuclease ABC subunit UvrC [Acidobacteria bacterium]|nr:excinuclease ABC subunit UvrC [Acidobacteriota bacterium]